MKKLGAFFIILTILMGSCACSAMGEQIQVIVSFYPIYILSMNVFEGIDDIILSSMTAPDTGCLHDYQLLTKDMMKLSDADAFIVCGAGMEAYLPDIEKQFPDLPLIDCSTGIDLIANEHHDEDVDEEESEYNAHTWLDVQNAIQIVHTIAADSSELFPEYSDILNANARAYIARLQALDAELRQMLLPVQGEKIVTFHEAFPYFANAYGLEIAAVISEEHENTLSPAKLSEVIESVKAAGVPPLFTEPQYSAAAAFAVAAETGAKIYTLDPLASGAYDQNAYENGMLENAASILQAFEE
ncbi:MAG: zinc ABC transporter substrate-binding protein [Clostridia bacterium]|nr:zinc ABC transporter substrate-binding protein [Clostridia bacterium]